eukprot:TRINITY_DN15024_c0_g1_i1.p1 TRINITY_DN15024_c0_g1~~TRINITY_DN15024_c0_g1_i1.p1  ORF type:complete len:385 (-),score=66.46 TRINITY_DN15024_c0_g1_i1:349-1503(-)
MRGPGVSSQGVPLPRRRFTSGVGLPGHRHTRFIPPYRLRITFTNFVLVSVFLFSLTALIGYWRLPKSDQKEATSLKSETEEPPFASSGMKPTLEVCEQLRRGKGRPWVCAHGGDTSRAPPNTMAAYDLAIQAGVECVEVDASRTADGVLVALHDRDLQAFSQRPGIRVGDLSLAEILSYDAGARFPGFHGFRVPTLLEALQRLAPRVLQVTVDIKPGRGQLRDDDMAAAVLGVINQAECPPTKCLAWAKQDTLVAAIKSLSPPARAGYIVMNDSSTGMVGGLLRMVEPEVVGVAWELVTPELVNQARSAGKEIHVWTVNSTPAMRRMVEAGVEAIVTNDPQALQRILAEYRQSCQAQLASGKERVGGGGGHCHQRPTSSPADSG